MLTKRRDVVVGDEGALGLRLELSGSFLQGVLLFVGQERHPQELVGLADSRHVLGQRASIVEHAAKTSETPEGHWEVLEVGVLDIHIGSVGHEPGLDASPGPWYGHQLETDSGFCLEDTYELPVSSTPLADFVCVHLGVLQGLDPVFGLHVRPRDLRVRAGLVLVDWGL